MYTFGVSGGAKGLKERSCADFSSNNNDRSRNKLHQRQRSFFSCLFEQKQIQRDDAMVGFATETKNLGGRWRTFSRSKRDTSNFTRGINSAGCNTK